ncbi:M1 family metallopeptidase [Kutzneria buriramensis]|uniref:Aminopeptidase N n=1 Tax=Kutzneria buriramensis TaxID=1045776 RepID=A0A3E0GYU4_9PSEU|nr:M1 family metallopeptidase [Kutzneria buriramensis]REH32976.1 peptidase M1-like protein [Kutzneria buriramensis]
MRRSTPAAAATAALCLVVAAPAFAGPAPGADSLGDRVFTALGNGGYDVQHYDVSYDYRAGSTLMDSAVRIDATATQSLSSFSLDSVVRKINSVTVDGRAAAFRTQDANEKLYVTPDRPVGRGQHFDVEISYVSDRTYDPKSPAPADPQGRHWFEKPDGFVTFAQPDRAHEFFPSNDYPSDKARFTTHITVPNDVQAVSNGTLRDKKTVGDRTTYTYGTRDPIPTDTAVFAVGHFTEITAAGPHGLPLRSYVTASQADASKTFVNDIPSEVAWVEQHLGPYPFETYGVLGVDGEYFGAMENATLSTFNAQAGLQGPIGLTATMVHELVHQWFGDAVSVRNWSDMWLSEGHASFYSFLYQGDKGFRPTEDGLHSWYQQDNSFRASDGPPGRPKDTISVLGTTNSMALMLYGLRYQVGVDTFQRIERTFFERFRNRSAATQDYIDVANQVSGKDFTGYVKDWLYSDHTPPMPGHPDWQPGSAT